jgi:hypothetical protein
MTPKLLTFIRLLRASGVRLSVAESLDALDSVSHLGVHDRDQLRLALRTTLVKSQRDFATFDALFERFFTIPRRRRQRRARPGEAADAARGQRPSPQPNTSPSRSIPRPVSPFPPAAGAPTTPPQQTPHAAPAAPAPGDLADLEQAWQQQLQSRPGSRPGSGSHQDEPHLEQTRLDRDFPPEQLVHMYREVERLVARLLTRRARRYRRTHRGQFDLRRTVLQGLRSGSEVPFTFAYRRRRLSKLRLAVLCDVSGSVWQVSTFLLKLVHTLQAEFSSVRSFLFVNGMVDVTPLFRHMRFPEDLQALRHYPNLNLFGYSDFGRTFYQFYRDVLGDLSRDTVLLILGDARNNALDPQAWTLEEMHQRCRRVIWLNPEPRQDWNQDDSVIDVYAAFCDDVLECWTLEHLAQAATLLLQP